LNPIIKNEENNRIEIISRGSGFKLERLFFEAIQEAHDEGYKVAKGEDLLVDIPMRNYQSTMQGKWVGYKEGSDPSDKVKVEKKEEVIIKAKPTPEPKQEIKEEAPVSESKTKKAGRTSKKKK